jgi:hypothetical protein
MRRVGNVVPVDAVDASGGSIWIKMKAGLPFILAEIVRGGAFGRGVGPLLFALKGSKCA